MSINTQILNSISQRNLLLLVRKSCANWYGQYPIGFWQGFINMNKSLRGFLHHQHVCLLVSVCFQLWEKRRFVMNTSPPTFPNSRGVHAWNSPTNIHLKWMIHLYPEFLPDYQIETSFCCSKCKAKAVLPPQPVCMELSVVEEKASLNPRLTYYYCCIV